MAIVALQSTLGHLWILKGADTMGMRFVCRLFVLACVGWMASLAAAEESSERAQSPSPEQIEFFEKQVRPIFANHCHKCHGSKKQEGGLRLDSRAAMLTGGDTGPALVPFEPDRSEFIAAIQYDPSGYQMPPTGKLDEDQIAALTTWVKMGAPWPDSPETGTPADESGFDWAARADHWSLQPVKNPIPPDVRRRDWPQTAVDAFLLARLEEAGLTPNPPTDKRTLLRRVTFDLTGLPPTRDEMAAFLADESPSAYGRVVERLLASPAYGERWARHWLDLVRFAETSGHEFDYEIEHAWRYRDYVIRALNADLPYDQFVLEHVAGDLLAQPRYDPVLQTNESVIATGFFWFGQGKHSPVDIRAEECDTIDNQIDVMTKTFLATTVACARCHDHKFDAVTARDYYALAGYLQSSRQQWAILDRPEPTQRIVRQLKELRAEHEGRIVEQAAEQFIAAWQPSPRGQIASANRHVEPMPENRHEAGEVTEATNTDAAATEKFSQKWLDRLPDSETDPLDPFYAWARLGHLDERSFPAKRTALWKELVSRNRSADERLSRSIVFEDFDASVDHEWFVTGPAFREHSTQGGELLLGRTPDQPVRRLARPGAAHSGLVSGRLQGAIRSPTFPIEKRYIHYRMVRHGGKSAPGRQNKNGQVNLIVHGFQLIRNPLYGHLAINVKQAKTLQWYTQDVSKFLGDRAYIEALDEDDGYLVIDQVVFSDDAAPPERPNRLILEILADDTVTSPEILGKRYQTLLAETVALWRSGRLAASTHSGDRVDLLNRLLERGQLEGPADSNAEIAAFLARHRELEERIAEPQRALALVDGSAENERLLPRGNHKKPGEAVERRFLEVLGGDQFDPPAAGSGRLRLARQMIDPSNPLLARVMVNRLWQHHFGRGIVATPDDFGRMGQSPSHPDLLDYLATEFVRSGWSLKHMHRLMVMSQAYQMSSRPMAESERRDPENVLLHRMPVRRLEAEAIRDAVLAVSGRLDRQMFGPSVPPYLTAFMEGRGRPRESGPLDGDGRRSIYINVRRNFLTPMFLAFDYPTPLTTMGRRSVSNVPAQALTMMNNEFVVEQARVWAEGLLDHAESDRDRITRLYESAYGRLPTESERSAALEFLAAQVSEYDRDADRRAWSDLCHVLMNVKEFVFVP